MAQTIPAHRISPRYRIAMEVLECAKDAGDATVIAACRRFIRACDPRDRSAADFALICEFHQAGR
jgi:hypothetical protein